jgi:hypothetical protein
MLLSTIMISTKKNKPLQIVSNPYLSAWGWPRETKHRKTAIEGEKTRKARKAIQVVARARILKIPKAIWQLKDISRTTGFASVFGYSAVLLTIPQFSFDHMDIPSSKPSKSSSAKSSKSSKSLDLVSSSAKSSNFSRPTSPNPPENSSSSGKVTLKDFSTPAEADLAAFAKSIMRQAVVYGPTFPSAARVSRLEYTWNEIESKVKASQNPGRCSTLLRFSANVQQKKKLITYVSVEGSSNNLLVTYYFQSLYARSSLISEIGSKARAGIKSFFSFRGTPDDISEIVKWLTQDGNFSFGDVDCKASLFYFIFHWR